MFGVFVLIIFVFFLQGGECGVVPGADRAEGCLHPLLRQGAFLSDTMYLLISYRKSTPPQNRQLNVQVGTGKH